VPRSVVGYDSSLGIGTHYGLDGQGIKSCWRWDFCMHPDHPYSPPSLLYNGNRVFPGVKQQGRGIDPSHLAPRLKKEYSYYSTSTPSLGRSWVWSSVL